MFFKGWKEGQGLGKSCDGIVEPIRIQGQQIANQRIGLGKNINTTTTNKNNINNVAVVDNTSANHIDEWKSDGGSSSGGNSGMGFTERTDINGYGRNNSDINGDSNTDTNTDGKLLWEQFKLLEGI
jgi:hypothetical protein